MLFDVLKLAHGLIYNTRNLQFLLLQLNNPSGNRGFLLFMESNLRRLDGCFNGKIVCGSRKMSLIDSFGLCFSFWLIDLTMFCISKFEQYVDTKGKKILEFANLFARPCNFALKTDLSINDSG